MSLDRTLDVPPFDREGTLRGAPPDSRGAPQEPHRFDWRVNVVLFAATVVSVFLAGAMFGLPGAPVVELPRGWSGFGAFLASGWRFALPLLAILLAHEFGHYFAARWHRVPASLPYFVPLPMLGFGTLGAIIAMPARIRSRNALLDIGASGPLAGMVVALPVIAIGLRLSPVLEVAGPGIQEGQSILYLLMKYWFVGPIPDGYDVRLHPTAFAGWAGFLITMINLIPFGQLDGGHIAYALFRDRHHAMARWVRSSLLGLFLYNLIVFVGPVVAGNSTLGLGEALNNSVFWLLWFGLLFLLARLSGGVEHPPTEPGPLSPVRRKVAWGTLVLFVLLFMPTPLSTY
jgi:membrane-associated protease RseP (regulator of RpoE activity)